MASVSQGELAGCAASTIVDIRFICGDSAVSSNRRAEREALKNTRETYLDSYHQYQVRQRQSLKARSPPR